MYAFETGGVAKPGLIKDLEKGAGIYRLSMPAFGKFVSQVPSPLGIGKVVLKNGDDILGFIAETEVARIGKEITDLGDWRKFC